MDDGRALSFRPGALAGGAGAADAYQTSPSDPSNAASLVNSWLTPADGQPSKLRPRTAARIPQRYPLLRGRPHIAAHRRAREWVRPTPSWRAARQRRPAQPEWISGNPFYLGTFAASEESVVHARHLPAGQCASSFASRGGSRGAIGPTILSIDLPVAPVAISTVLARLSHRRRAREAPRGSPCAGPFASDRALFAARRRRPAKPTTGMIRSRTLEPWSRHAGARPGGRGGREVCRVIWCFREIKPSRSSWPAPCADHPPRRASPDGRCHPTPKSRI
jgi:hypothetical protein